MGSPRVLLIDTTQYAPTTPLYGDALRQLTDSGSIVGCFFDEASLYDIPSTAIHRRLYFRSKGEVLGAGPMRRRLVRLAAAFRPDVVIAVKAAWLDERTLLQLKEQHGTLLVNILTDDPFNRRVAGPTLRHALPAYDVCASTKELVIEDLYRAGCKRPTYLPFGYKESVHYPEKPADESESTRFECDVAFVGTCDEERAPYLLAVAQALPNARVRIYGGSWGGTPVLNHLYRGYATGRDYRLAVGGAIVTISFVRRSNRDTLSMRTFEIPAMHGFLLADRTDAQTTLLREGREAAYFSSSDELIQKIAQYLGDVPSRDDIAQSGYKAITTGSHTYTDRLRSLLELSM